VGAKGSDQASNCEEWPVNTTTRKAHVLIRWHQRKKSSQCLVAQNMKPAP
jgi:hypothetical protein